MRLYFALTRNGPHNAAPRFRRNIAFHIKYDDRGAGGVGRGREAEKEVGLLDAPEAVP